MSNPYWVKSGGMGSPWPGPGMVPPVQQHMAQQQPPPPTAHDMSQHHMHQEYQNMNWPNSASKAGSAVNHLPQPIPTTVSAEWPWNSSVNTSGVQQFYGYDQHSQGIHAQHQQQEIQVNQQADPWDWGSDDTSAQIHQQPAPQQQQQQQQQQQPLSNNNFNQSFQNDSSWNWSIDQSSAPQEPVQNYYQVGYGGQYEYSSQGALPTSQVPSNINQGFHQLPLNSDQNSHLLQARQSTEQYSDHPKGEAGDVLKTEPQVDSHERTDDSETAQIEPAMSDVSKNSMTPQWSIESQMSQDSDDISPSLAGGDSTSAPSTLSMSPISASQIKSEERLSEYGHEYSQELPTMDLQSSRSGMGDAPAQHSVDYIDRHSNLNLDETIAALENLSVAPDNREVVDPALLAHQAKGLPSLSNVPSATVLSSLPRSSAPPPSGMSGPPPSRLPPPSGLPPPAGAGAPAGGNPYAVSRSGLTHKAANKSLTSTGSHRQMFASPLAPGSGSVESPANLEAPPDNHERPDNVENRLLDPPAGQEMGRHVAVAAAPWTAPDNQEVAPRFGLDRNQYLETGQLTTQTSEEENVPPPGLHRLVTGQLTEQDSQLEVSTPPPGLDRMIPGQMTESEGPRLVPGRMMTEDDDDDDDLRVTSRTRPRSSSRDQSVDTAPSMRRMIPGHTDSQLTEDEDDIPLPSMGPNDPPPGLHRMVPGESSSPESQGGAAAGGQSGQSGSNFQPIEPRVVTGVSRESMPQPQQVEPRSPSPDQSLDTHGVPTLQPTSERSETIGSDSVDAKAPDPKKSDRRLEEEDEEGREHEGREPRYYRRDEDGDLERDLSPSDSNRRYRGAGDRRTRERDRDRESDHERERDRRYDPRRDDPRRDDPRRDDPRRDDPRRDDPRREKSRRGYRGEEDADSDSYNSDRDNRRWGRDRDSERDRHRERNGDRDRDRERYYRDRYREGDRGRYPDDYDRQYYRRGERDRGREKGREPGRDEPDKGRKSGRRSDEHYRSYEDDYYRERRSSRPSSRSGSVHEYSHGYEREYARDERPADRHGKQNNPYYHGGYYYSPQDYYRYQMYYTNLRKTDPEAYAAWYRKYYAQYASSQPGTYENYTEDRGSVHSGRSSANDELGNDRYSRRKSPNTPQNYYQKSPQTSSSNRYQSTDNASPFSRDSGRGVGRGESSLDETNSSIQRLTPFKFSTAHVKGILTKRGQLMKILPHYPVDGQPAVIELHSLQPLISQDANLHDLLALPGPLVRGVTHKKTIILYLRTKMESARSDPSLQDRQSVILLYELLILLLKQNGMIVGTDIAELLLRNGEWAEAEENLSISGSAEPRAQSTPSPAPSGGSRTSSVGAATSSIPAALPLVTQNPHQVKLSEAEITHKFREFLLYGNTKEALEWAMKHGLWGHALFLSSKLDQRMYHSVMTRFANGLALTDPIQTLYQLLSGWQPAAVTCVSDEKWGDWRPHLAMILSNTSTRPEVDHKAIMTLGDTLAARGCLHASHFCYLMAQHPFGTYAQRSSKLVLLGSSHLKPFSEFATSEAVMITSIYEYARSLADASFHIPNLQPYKYLMATRLVELGLLSEAVHYCEIISQVIAQNPQQYDSSFVHDVAELSESLKYNDPFYATSGDVYSAGDPDWLVQIRSISNDYRMGMLHSNVPSYGGSLSNLTYNDSDAVHNSVYDHSSLSAHDAVAYSGHETQAIPPQQQQQDLQQYYHDQQIWGQQQQQQQLPPEALSHEVHSAQTHPQASEHGAYSSDGYVQPVVDQSSWWSGQQGPSASIEPEAISTSSAVGPNHLEPPQPMQVQSLQQQESSQLSSQGSMANNLPSAPSESTASKTKPQKPTNTANTHSNSSWFGGLWNKLALRPKNQMKLPDDKNPSIVWDDQKKRWMNVDADGEEESASLAPPPKMSEMTGRFSTPAPALAPAAASIPSTPSAGPLMSNGTVGPSLKSPANPLKAVEDKENNAAKPPTGSNIFKLPRGRSLKASYVDVMNPSGTKPAAQSSLPAPELFPPMSNVHQSSTNYFVPAAVEGIENAPADFLTPSSGFSTSDSGQQDAQQLSRWSSTSSLSREVQSYTSRRPPSRNQLQGSSAGPQMFNPAQFSQPAAVSSMNRKWYPN